jgi:hypothetical protein
MLDPAVHVQLVRVVDSQPARAVAFPPDLAVDSQPARAVAFPPDPEAGSRRARVVAFPPDPEAGSRRARAVAFRPDPEAGSLPAPVAAFQWVPTSVGAVLTVPLNAASGTPRTARPPAGRVRRIPAQQGDSPQDLREDMRGLDEAVRQDWGEIQDLRQRVAALEAKAG